MNQIMVVYWSQTGNTEAMANAVAEGIRKAGKDALVTEVSNISADALKDAGVFALGCPAHRLYIMLYGFFTVHASAAE